MLKDKGSEYASSILQPLQKIKEFAMSRMALDRTRTIFKIANIFLNTMNKELEGEKND